ncbi:MAG: DNA polymerase III subunit beta [Patescibacteria group bacterium]|nr:DNA polymerase III subunit beta [Patescibacteria group bacterium]
MKISCLQENLSEGLSIVTRVVSTTGSLPVLSNVLLETEEGRLKLQATDLETGVTTWVGAKIEEEGAITVPAKVFSRLVSDLAPGEISLKTEKKNLFLEAEGVESRFNGLSADEFPDIPEFTDEGFELKASEIAEGIDEVIFAAAKDEGRPVLTGVLFRSSGKELVMVAVDGFRLAEKKLTFEKELPEMDFIIPARTLREVSLLLGGEDQTVKMAQVAEENQILFQVGDVRFSSRLLEGDFPNYREVVPDSFNVNIELDRAEFLKAVRLASLFAEGGANVVRLDISPENNVLSVSANAQEIGSNKVEVPIRGEGEDSKIAFNAKYLTDCLSALSSDKVIFEMIESLKPGAILPKDVDDYLHVIMPVRVQE